MSLSGKRWYRLIPVVFITFGLAFVDRANFGFALAGGMGTDLGISSATSSLLGSLFFLGYFCFQIPGAHYASKKSAKKLIFWSLIFWGLLATATGFVQNIFVLALIRFLLGVVESAVMPALLIFLSNWFVKSERSRANAFLVLGNPATMLWMSIVSGYLIQLYGWRWMFFIEGAPSVLWAFVWWMVVAERPRNAKWLSGPEKDALETQLLKEQEEIPPVKSYKAAFRSKKVIGLCLQYGLWNVGVFGFVMWLPSIIKQAPNIDIVGTGWLSAVPYLVAILGIFVVSYFSDKSMKREPFIWPFLLVAAILFYVSYLLGTQNFWLSFTLLALAGGAMYAPYPPFFALITEILPKNVAGGAIALINSVGALGSFAGAYVVGYLNSVTGSYDAAYFFMSVCLLIAALVSVKR